MMIVKASMEGLLPQCSRSCIIIVSAAAILVLCVLTFMNAETALGRASQLTSNMDIDKDLSVRSTQQNVPLYLIDDSSCSARIQHLLYRKDPQRFMSSATFDNAWKRYEELHKSCSQGKNWTHIFLYERKQNDDCKYLVVMEGPGGLGNKLLALTSAFAYALATDRVVLVDSRLKYKELLCEPFQSSSWFLPLNFPYQNVSNAPALDVAIDKDYKDLDLIHLQLSHVQSWADSQFFCYHTQPQLKGVRWVAWTSNQYYLTRLLMIPSVWESLHPLFKENYTFTQLSHRILLPRNELWARILRLYWGYFSGSGNLIGLQIRLHKREDLGAFDELVFNQVVDCLQSRKILPKLRKEEDFDNLMKLYLQRQESDRRRVDISVLVTSLQSRYYDEIKDLYAERPNVNDSMISFNMVSHFGHQDTSRRQSDLAFMEMWLLSFSDVLVTSAYSTFGYVAAGLGGLTPIVLNINGDVNGINQSSCYESQSTEPCTHFPMKPTCRGVTVNHMHSEWMRHHVKECQDLPGGLQLVAMAEQPNNSCELWEHIHS